MVATAAMTNLALATGHQVQEQPAEDGGARLKLVDRTQAMVVLMCNLVTIHNQLEPVLRQLLIHKASVVQLMQIAVL